MFTVFGRAYPAYEIDRPRDHKPLVVLSAGHDVPVSGAHVQTLRPEGRRDYQILYIRSGSAHFFWDEKDYVISSGQIVLYRPGEYQRYEYRIEDAPDVYWIHFTGSGVEEELDGMGLKRQVFSVGVNDQYAGLFDSIIQELQFKDAHFDDMTASYFKELLCLFSRELLGQRAPTHTPRTREVEDAVSFFNTHFNQRLNLSEYAARQNMSLCWFTRIFRRQMGVSPQQYLMEIRINNACELLGSGVSIAETCDMVGYTDSGYFSRIFKKYTGYSPMEYRKLLN